MRDKMLKRLAHLHTSHPVIMLVVIIIVTIIFVAFANQLSTTMRVSDLLPEKNPRVVQFNNIIEEFATATNLIVVVQGHEDRIKEFADELAPEIVKLKDDTRNQQYHDEIKELENEIKELKSENRDQEKIEQLQSKRTGLENRIDYQLFQRVDYKAEVDFLRNHLLMLIKEDDLKNTKDIFTDPNLRGLITNLNNSMEKEYVGQQESMSTREKEDGAWQFLDGIENLIIQLQKAVQAEELTEQEIRKTADKLLLGEPYMLSYDKRALVMIAVPTFTIMDRDLLMVAAESVQQLVDDMLQRYPDVNAGLSGSIAREHDEQVYAQQSFSYTTIIAFVFILILLIISFRMWIAPVFAILTLFIGVVWAMGATYLAVGQLNMMTAMMSVILLGLGIDFAIHLITGFTERRAAGDSIAESLEKTFLKSAKGIITGAFTTACAFLSLMISEARGMRELGIVIGVGLLSVLLATMFVLPVMLVLRERRVDRKREQNPDAIVKRDISFRFLGRTAEWLGKRYVFTVIASVIITALLIWSAFNISFDHNFMNVEPEGLTSIALQDTVLEKFDLNMEYALILAESISESRELAEQSRNLPTVAMTDDISIYLPSLNQQKNRLPHIQEVKRKMKSTVARNRIETSELRHLKNEINRLQLNVMEMQDMAFLGGQDKVDNKCKKIVGNPANPQPKNIIEDLLEFIESNSKETVIESLSKFQRSFAPHFKESVLKMCVTEPIYLNELPVSILDRYSNISRDKYLVTVYPSGNLWEDKDYLDRFAADLDLVSMKATGSAPLFIALIDIFARDGRNAILLTLVIVFFLLLFDFRSPRNALMAMIPLACGIFWMVGVMHIVGMKLNFINVIGLPLIIGIGIDDGVHIIHRWRHEGKGHIRTIFASTGKAIFLTSLTTMFAFGSLYFSIFRGWASFGAALFIGVGACFLTTVLILPGIIGWIERR
ncbi:MMPL family transporter [candidate division KSB1 bacterium]|nr:MMPL family transporter [candidate division KSB1 bacterium]